MSFLEYKKKPYRKSILALILENSTTDTVANSAATENNNKNIHNKIEVVCAILLVFLSGKNEISYFLVCVMLVFQGY
jgi:hypothetical protein